MKQIKKHQQKKNCNPKKTVVKKSKTIKLNKNTKKCTRGGNLNIFKFAISVKNSKKLKKVKNKRNIKGKRFATAISRMVKIDVSKLVQRMFDEREKLLNIIKNHGDKSVNQYTEVTFEVINKLIVIPMIVLCFFHAKSRFKEKLVPNLIGKFGKIHKENQSYKLFETHYTLAAISAITLDSNGCKFFDILTDMNLAFATGYESDLQGIGKMKKTRRYAVAKDFLTTYKATNAVKSKGSDKEVSIQEIMELGHFPEDCTHVTFPMFGDSRKLQKEFDDVEKRVHEGYYVPINLQGLEDYMDSFNVVTESDALKLSPAKLDLLVQTRFLKQELENKLYEDDEDNGKVYYLSKYIEQPGGRWTEIEGGLQNQLPEIKRALFKGINVYNYDLAKCHPTIICERLGKTVFLGKYINGEITQSDLAEEIFGSKDAVCIAAIKKIINGMCYGMSASQGYSLSDILRDVQKKKNLNISLKDLHERVASSLSELVEDLNNFQEYVKKYIHYNSKIIKGERHVKLPIGNTMIFGKDMTHDELMTYQFHFITSFETFIIRNIMVEISDNCDESVCDPIVNMYDGFITVGKIPELLLEKILKEVIYPVCPLCKLVEKPL